MPDIDDPPLPPEPYDEEAEAEKQRLHDEYLDAEDDRMRDEEAGL